MKKLFYLSLLFVTLASAEEPIQDSNAIDYTSTLSSEPIKNDEIPVIPSVPEPALNVSSSSASILPPLISTSSPSVDQLLENYGLSESSQPVLEKVSIDDSGNRLLILIQVSKPVECFVFERRDPPSLFIQFTGTT
ncbi:MAG: hypothetical protein ACKVQC_08575, partial [Elusimicrobiota bacterium]